MHHLKSGCDHIQTILYFHQAQRSVHRPLPMRSQVLRKLHYFPESRIQHMFFLLPAGLKSLPSHKLILYTGNDKDSLRCHLRCSDYMERQSRKYSCMHFLPSPAHVVYQVLASPDWPAPHMVSYFLIFLNHSEQS